MKPIVAGALSVTLFILILLFAGAKTDGDNSLGCIAFVGIIGVCIALRYVMSN